MKENVTFDPIEIGLLCTNAEVFGSYAVSNAIQQFLFCHINPLRFNDAIDRLPALIKDTMQKYLKKEGNCWDLPEKRTTIVPEPV
jgi:hypothetical protein